MNPSKDIRTTAQEYEQVKKEDTKALEDDIKFQLLNQIREKIYRQITIGMEINIPKISEDMVVEVKLPEKIQIREPIDLTVHIPETSDSKSTEEDQKKAEKSNNLPGKIRIQMSIEHQGPKIQQQVIQIKVPHELQANVDVRTIKSGPRGVFHTYLSAMNISEETLKDEVSKVKSEKGPNSNVFTVKEYGEHISKCRAEQKVRVERLANMLGISKSTLSDIENGNKKSIDFDIFRKIVEILECSPDYLLGRADVRDDATGEIESIYDGVVDPASGVPMPVPFRENSVEERNVLRKDRDLAYLLMKVRQNNLALFCILTRLLKSRSTTLYSRMAKLLYVSFENRLKIKYHHDFPCSQKDCVKCLFDVVHSAK